MSSWVVNRKGEPQYRRHFLTDNSTFHVERCMSVMQSGTQMVKVKAGSKGLVRLFYLDEHRSCIRWKPSRKSEKAKITIDSLYKVTEGSQSDIFHRHPDGSFDPACCFTVYHGNHMESLDLVTSNAEEARTWITGLRFLMAGISDEDSLAKRQRTHDQWMKQTFEEADKNGDGLLNIDEMYQLLHKLNVNLPRRKVKQMFQTKDLTDLTAHTIINFPQFPEGYSQLIMECDGSISGFNKIYCEAKGTPLRFQEADTDDQQGTLTYEEFSVFYKMMSMRRDLFLLMMVYSDRKDHLTVEELANLLRNEQKMANVTSEYVADIIKKFELSDENKLSGVMGIEGFTSFMRSPACDVFNPLHHEVNQDMDQPLCNYFIASSHNTYLTGDQLLSHSKTDMYAWVLQSGCRCVEVDCWDGPDGEPMVQHGYTLTSKIPFKSVIETINKYAFVNNQYPLILSIENHCNIQQQKKIAQYLREIFGDKLDVRDAMNRNSTTLPSPACLQGKILIKGKRLPAYLSADVEEGEVSDDDSADEIEDDFKLKSSNGNGNHQVESHIRKKLDSLLKESQIGDKEDSDSFSIRALLRATHQGLQKNLRQSSKGVLRKSQSRSFITSLKQKRHSKSRLSCHSMEKEDDGQEGAEREAGGQFNRGGRKRKTMKLSRDLSNLVVFTNSVASQECLNEGTPGDVLSFSETRAQSLVNHRTEQFLTFNQRQLSRIYPSAYRIDSSNFNPQFYWNVGCHLVALNYQTEGRMMQLNRAKFMVNGGIGYVLKPPPMCKGSFNPFSDDPLPAYPKKQLILKIISGQQLPKPPDSMLGDRGEIIDPFVEVEIIGLPVDCCKEQTRVVDDNGFNPVWEETLSFTLHMAEVALVRFLVWDHDPIGRDFIGQRTVAFSSLMPGYRHVYLEGLTEASIFVHVSVHDVYGKWSPLVLNPSFTIMHFLGSNKGHQLRGIRGLFNRSSKSSVDTNTAGLRKRSISDHLLRRTASAPAKGRKKTKIALSESVASLSDQKSSTSTGAGGEGTSGKDGGVEKRLQPRPPLIHRPVSMPLDRLLQGQLSLCSPDKEQQDKNADTVIGGLALNKPRSSSVDKIANASFSLEVKTSFSHRNKEFNQSKEHFFLSSGRGEEKKEEDYVNYKSEANLNIYSETKKNSFSPPLLNGYRRSEKTETSSNSTLFTVGLSVSSSSSALSSAVPLSPVSMNADVKSPSSAHDSTISRLIDAVSLGNDQDTCGSISVLIGQLEDTVEQKTSTAYYESLQSCLSNFRSTTPKEFKFLLENDRTSPHKKQPQSPQSMDPTRATKIHNNFSSCSISQPASPAPALMSSPETAEIEEVYTILDEEVLLPVSVYNLKKQTIHVQADTVESTSSSSLGSSPTKVVQGVRKEPTIGWNSTDTLKGAIIDPEGMEERVYEEVGDSSLMTITDLDSYNLTSSSTNYGFQLPHNYSGNVFTEVEINVDEDPSEKMLISPRCGPRPEELQSPTKRFAIYQNHNCSPCYAYQNSPTSSNYNPHYQYSKHSSGVAFSPRQSPINQFSNNNLHQDSFQPSFHHRPADLTPSNPSPMHQNSYPLLQCNSKSLSNSRDFPCSSNLQLKYNSCEIPNRSRQDRKGFKTQDVEFIQNGFDSSESLSSQCNFSNNVMKNRCPMSPSLDSEAVYSLPDDNCLTSLSHSRASYNTKPHSQGQMPFNSLRHPRDSTTLDINSLQQKKAETKTRSADIQSHTTNSTAQSPCKSKSLGDLTSEDISCNFQSKYHIISRSFITPHMKKQKMLGRVGEGASQSQSSDPLTEQLRRLVSLDGEEVGKEWPLTSQLHQDAKYPVSHPQATGVSPAGSRDADDSPPPLTRRLSSRSQSRVRNINNRARERQQEALKPRAQVSINSTPSIGSVILRNKPASHNQQNNRHSTGSYIAGYFSELEDRGLPEGACTSLRYGNMDYYGDQYYTDATLSPGGAAASEPEVYFLLRL